MEEESDSFRIKFSEDSVKLLRDIFHSKDADESGTIDKNELGECLRAVGFMPTDCDVEELIIHFDTNGDGKLQINEIINNLHIVNARSLHKKELTEAFQTFDTNKDGFIRLPELLKALTANQGMDVEKARKLIDHLVRKYDKNNDGKFDYSEFVEMCLCDELPPPEQVRQETKE